MINIESCLKVEKMHFEHIWTEAKYGKLVRVEMNRHNHNYVTKRLLLLLMAEFIIKNSASL